MARRHGTGYRSRNARVLVRDLRQNRPAALFDTGGRIEKLRTQPSRTEWSAPGLDILSPALLVFAPFLHWRWRGAMRQIVPFASSDT